MSSVNKFPARIQVLAVLAWALLLVAAYYAFRWVPYEPLSAAGDLSYITPAVAALTASLASVTLLVAASSLPGTVSRAGRFLLMLPLVLSVLVGAVVYLRA